MPQEALKSKVLIVDDSAIIRNVVSHIVESSPRLEIWDKAINGKYALEKIQRALNRENPNLPDIIVSDLEMPEMGGLEFLRQRRAEGINIPVVVLSSLAASGASITMEALNLGACDFVQKPTGGSREIERVSEQLIHLLEKYGEAYRASSRTQKNLRTDFSLGTEQAPSEGIKKGSERMPRTPIGAVAIGISTGGPYALRRLLQAIPADFPVPILIVQHMPVGFTEEFAKGLGRICPLEVREARHGDIVKAGRVYIAPGGKHMQVEQKTLACIIKITDEAPQNSHKPSAGKLFQSMAQVYGSRAMGVIMTGMGHDGSEEIGEIYRLGGVTIGQDEASSVVYGMPKVAEQKGFLDYILNLEEIAPKMVGLVKYSIHGA